MSWEKLLEIVPVEVICAVIAAAVSLVGAVISYFANRYKVNKEIKKMKLEWEREDQLRSEDAASRREQETDEAYSKMAAAVAEYMTLEDLHHQTDAAAKVAALAAKETGDLANLLDKLQKMIIEDDQEHLPDGLQKVIIERRKRKAQQQASN